MTARSWTAVSPTFDSMPRKSARMHPCERVCIERAVAFDYMRRRARLYIHASILLCYFALTLRTCLDTDVHVLQDVR